VGIGCAAQLVCIFVFNALTVVYNRYMQRAPPCRSFRDPMWTAATPGAPSQCLRSLRVNSCKGHKASKAWAHCRTLVALLLRCFCTKEMGVPGMPRQS